MANSTLHVPVSGLRWALVRRLLLAIPIGLFLGGILINAFGVGTAAAMIGGLVFSFAVFLGTIGLVGRRRRAVLEADGGEADAIGVLLLGVMVSETGNNGDGGHSGSGGGD
ncbi:MAG: hypothetical protein JWN19_3302 [Arthrobacter sp.]|jgi:hypothetical protein|nr:hypothetical protein [Arthrobacter sp.]